MDDLLPASVNKLGEYGGLVTLAVSVIAGLSYLVHFLINRLAKQGDRYLDTIEENTAVLSKIATQVQMLISNGKN